MKTPAFSQAGLLLIAGTVVILIGALVKFDPGPTSPKPASLADATPSAQALEDAQDESATNALLPANFPASLAQIVKLHRAGLTADVIIGFIQNSGEPYAPTADEIVYLHQIGVPSSVMTALVKQKAPPPQTPPATLLAHESPPREAPPEPSPSPAPIAQPTTPAPAIISGSAPSAAPPPSGVAANFYDDLALYGDWTQTSEHGWAWQPTVVQAIPDWRPYRDDGQWQFTDAGWYWQSSYPWGWAPFHYGRWFNDPSRGWLWQPGGKWAPAWVSWRKSSSHFGWAPLPPGVSLNVEFALLQDRHLDISQADYGLTPAAFTFVPASHFLSRNLAKYAVAAQSLPAVMASSVTVKPKSHNGGLSPEEVSAAVHAPVKPLALRDSPIPTTRAPGISSHDLAVYRPNKSDK